MKTYKKINFKYLNTFKIQSIIDDFVIVDNNDELKQVLFECKSEEKEYFIVGNCSNIILGKNIDRYKIIKLGKDFQKIESDDNIINVHAGVNIKSLLNHCLKHGIQGYEFLIGIPGTLGGAIKCNAGTDKKYISDYIERVYIMDSLGDVKLVQKENLNFSYRDSGILKENIIIKAELKVNNYTDKETIANELKNRYQYKKSVQPLEHPSAGSIFKNPKKYKAWELIGQCGWSGYRLGGAEVSSKHCNFIVNTGAAVGKDIYRLGQKIKRDVYNKTGIKLEYEIILLGDFK